MKAGTEKQDAECLDKAQLPEVGRVSPPVRFLLLSRPSTFKTEQHEPKVAAISRCRSVYHTRARACSGTALNIMDWAPPGCRSSSDSRRPLTKFRRSQNSRYLRRAFSLTTAVDSVEAYFVYSRQRISHLTCRCHWNRGRCMRPSSWSWTRQRCMPTPV